MLDKQPSPLRASFWLTEQEKRYVLVICALFLIGLTVRHFYLKKEQAQVYTPSGLEKMESSHE